jgi:pilus assembly protein Flp/PilA
MQENRKMIDIKRALLALWKNEEGLTTVEYAVAGALISLAVVAAFTGLGTRVTAVITAITAALPAG